MTIGIKDSEKINMLYSAHSHSDSMELSVNKKVWMIRSLERSQGFRFSNDEYMDIDTISDLASAVLRRRG